MTNDIRLQNNKFEPGRELSSGVAKLEQRIVLNSTWKFPHGFVATLPGQTGPFVLTSRAYGDAQRMVDKAFVNFAGALAKVQSRVEAGTITVDQANALIGTDPNTDTYAPRSLLGRLECSLRAAECKIPFGRGVSVSAVSGTTLGVGLSDFSATGANASSLAGSTFNAGVGAPTYLRNNLIAAFDSGASYSEIHQLVQWTRTYSLRFHGTSAEPDWSWGGGGQVAAQEFGTLPGYVAQFGSSRYLGGSGDFGTKNS